MPPAEIPLLDALDAKEKEATPGPWKISLRGSGSEIVHQKSERLQLGCTFIPQDQDFIAALRNAYPALSRNYRLMVAALENLRETIYDGGCWCDKFRDGRWDHSDACKLARAALEAIKHE